MRKFGTTAERVRGYGLKMGSDTITVHPITLRSFKFKPEPGYFYDVVRAISSRVNANCDSWSPAELKERYSTFIGRGVYVEHENWNYKRARGVILDAKYEQTKLASGLIDGAVYLLLEVDAQQYPRLVHAVMNGKVGGVSMGTDVAYTICSICGNKAQDTREYCEHIPSMKGQVVSFIKDGKKVQGLVHEICKESNFFEISYVFDPADESAWDLDSMLVPERMVS